MENETKDMILEILNDYNRSSALKILAEILDENYDLKVASNIVKNDIDSPLDKRLFEDRCYDEGNEEAGFIELKTILNAIEEIVNCDDYMREKIEFEEFVRPETSEEMEDKCHNNGVEWWTEDENIDINKAYIQFQSV